MMKCRDILKGCFLDDTNMYFHSYVFNPVSSPARIYDYFLLCVVSEMLDPGVDFEKPVDVYAIGFEEIVDLNASNIVSARLV